MEMQDQGRWWVVFFLSWKNYRILYKISNFVYTWKVSHRETLKIQTREGTFAGAMPLTGERGWNPVCRQKGGLREEHSQTICGYRRDPGHEDEAQGGKVATFMITFRVRGSRIKEPFPPLHMQLLSATQHPLRSDLFFSLIAAEAQRDLVICTKSNS